MGKWAGPAPRVWVSRSEGKVKGWGHGLLGRTDFQVFAWASGKTERTAGGQGPPCSPRGACPLKAQAGAHRPEVRMPLRQ